MSSDRQEPNASRGYTPAKSGRISITDLRELKALLSDTGLTKWIVLAGVGGLVELLRAIVDVIQYVGHRVR